jgi:uncharacterized protein (UPF0261 family)
MMESMSKTVLLIGTLDTKGVELAHVRELIRVRGHEVLVLDAGVLGEPGFAPDISAAEVSSAGGRSLEELRRRGDRGEAVDVMIAGVRVVVSQLYGDGRFDGVLSLGGGGGTTIATAAMRELPVGVPKLMVSSVASSDTRPYMGVKDVTMMYSVVDIAGLNPLARRILANAAGAICGMVEQELAPERDRPLIAATMFGVTTPCVDRLRKLVEAAGYEMLVFHATGTGGRAMEGLIADGYIAAVADITTTEWCDEVVGGVLTAGPDRLSAAGHAGLPQVVSCGALDMVNFRALESVPERFRGRKLHRHNPNVTLMRTSPAECREIGRRIAEKLNGALGPTTLMIPLRGVSELDGAGQPFNDPEASAALFESLREHVRPPVEILELDLHINDPAFAEAAAKRLLSMLERSRVTAAISTGD